jgi:glucose-6-phosphate 1-dehydrogenase
MPEPNPSAPRCLLVIFGASGDLTKRKLVPAMHELQRSGQLPEHFAVLGVSRTKYTDEQFREELHEFDPDAYHEDGWDKLAPHVHYCPADATKADAWGGITDCIHRVAQEHGTGDNVLFYLSVSPQFFEPIINNIGRSGLVTEGKRWCSIGDERPWQRIVVEKPFGHDPQSAVKLNRTLGNVFDETSIYRIDHYLGKELVQNLLVLRFANTIFEPLWNHNYVDHVQITASETVGVEGRGSYYDGPAGGAMRDMVQSHLLQVLSLVAMEPPVSLDATDIRTEKIKAFKALRVPSKETVPQIAVRGQ